ncbi:MAG: cytochrome c [Nitrosospira multiformis]|nr:cytochrome c [Nitrosospira multiformis]
MQRLALKHMKLRMAVFDWMIRMDKKTGILLSAALLAMGAIVAGTPVSVATATADHAADAIEEDESTLDALVTRGAYLATIADCTGCHTAGSADPAFGGGLAINSPFGTIYSTNITPDPETGIGRYSYEDFSRAVRSGVRKDGKWLYPAMPYPSFTAMSDNDVRALYAYFMHGVKPVRRTPSQTRLPFPFNQRWTLKFWDFAFVEHKRFEPRADRGEKWNHGAYLVQTLGHCGACHTPRGLAYQEKAYSEISSDYLTGAMIDNWFAPELTGNAASGLGRWSEEEIAAFLKTGHSGHTVAFGSMITVIENSTQHFRREDLDAIAHYLKSLPARGEKSSYNPRGTPAFVPVGMIRFEKPGAGIYSGFCAKCHRHEGKGKPPKFPPLAGSSIVLSENASSLIRLMLEGGKGPWTKAGPKPEKMPGYAEKFTDREIAEVLTFIRNSWGNKAAPVTTREVYLMREALNG